MKNLLISICEEQKYSISRNNSGITLDLLIDGAISGNIVEFVRKATGCSKDAVTRAIKNTFPDKDPIKDRLIPFLLQKRHLRKCPKCSSIKDINDFYTSVSKSDGMFSWCKDCSKCARRESYSKDPSKEIASNSIRVKRMKEHQTPSWANLESIKDMYLKCPDGYQVDHIIPLNGQLVSGLHVENNLQYLTIKDNLSKNNKYHV